MHFISFKHTPIHECLIITLRRGWYAYATNSLQWCCRRAPHLSHYFDEFLIIYFDGAEYHGAYYTFDATIRIKLAAADDAERWYFLFSTIDWHFSIYAATTYDERFQLLGLRRAHTHFPLQSREIKDYYIYAISLTRFTHRSPVRIRYRNSYFITSRKLP